MLFENIWILVDMAKVLECGRTMRVLNTPTIMHTNRLCVGVVID